jgi:hypothetical protein
MTLTGQQKCYRLKLTCDVTAVAASAVGKAERVKKEKETKTPTNKTGDK